MTRFMLVLAAIFVSGCAGNDAACCNEKGGGNPTAKSGGEGQASSGSIWDQLERARKEKKTKGPTAAMQNEQAAKALPVGWKEKIDAWWKLYLTNDPGWPAARAEWLALPAPAPSSLAENLLRAYVVAWDAGQRSEVERAKDELISIPELSVPILVIGLSSGAGDTIVRNHSTDLLGAIGDPAVPEIERAWSGAKPKGKWELARALRKMKRPGAVPALARIALQRDAGFEPRIEAIQGLGELKDPAGYDAIVKCVSDPDRSVRKFAVQALGVFGRADAVPVLKSAAQQAKSKGETDVAEEAEKSLRILGNP